MTDEPTEKQRVDKLVRLARSWQNAPELILKSDGYQYNGYEIKQKAYILTKTSGQKDLHLSIKAGPEKPLLNPVFIINDFGKSNVVVKVNDKTLKQGEGFRIGYEETNTDIDLILWLKTESDKMMTLTIKQED